MDVECRSLRGESFTSTTTHGSLLLLHLLLATRDLRLTVLTTAARRANRSVAIDSSIFGASVRTVTTMAQRELPPSESCAASQQ